ncbi:RNA polymerase sigma factor [Brachybacterium sp.]|uniref:RNA polymerase sigma factor n=1 Tax=Brachybacterium sp. TaxID=1891286 RepID=UPI003F971327
MPPRRGGPPGGPRFGDLDLAEDAAQEAMESALRSWPEQGVPQQPLAWLTTVARRAALDRVRHDQTAARRLAELHVREEATAPPADEGPLTTEDVPDERLAMLMGCCHPAIAPADRIALMLRFVGALTSAEVAQALLLATPTLQARITRAKQRIAAHRIPLTVPTDPAERERRLPLVLTAISLIFTEGYSATSGDAPIRRELSAEAIRLARITRQLLPASAEAQGLLALLLLSDARSPAREDAEGIPVPLEDQDRSRWDAGSIAEGLALVEEAAARPDAGSFTVQAAIAAVHAEAPRFEDTDWAQVVALYDLLLTHGEDPVVRMNRAIAVGRTRGPAEGLALLEQLAAEPELARHHPFHISLALLREQLGRTDGAVAAWRRALDLAGGIAEQRFIRRRLARLGE